MIIFVGDELKGGFAREVASLSNVKETIEFISSKPHIKDQKAEILLAAKDGCSFIIYEIDQYLDDPEVIIDAILSIKRTNGADPILLVPTTNSRNSVIQEALSRGIKNFINSGESFSQQKEELAKCITGYYEDNTRVDIEKIKAAQEKREIRESSYKTIGVAGTERRIGTTTQALQIVRYLNSIGYKACMVELTLHKYENIKLTRVAGTAASFVEKIRLAYAIDSDDELIGGISCEGIDMYYKPERVQDIIDKGYDYLVYDYGCYTDKGFSKNAFLKDDIQIFCCGCGITEIDNTLNVLENLSYSKSNLIISFAAADEKESLLGYAADKSERCYFAGYTPDAFTLSDTQMYELLFKAETESAPDYKAEKEKKKLWKRKGK